MEMKFNLELRKRKGNEIMNKILLILTILVPMIAYSQGKISRPQKSNQNTKIANSISSTTNPKEEIFVAVEKQAEFPGGHDALKKWISNNIHYPEKAKFNGIQGSVVVKFVIEKDGSITNAEIVRGVDKDLNQEALRVVRKMTKWLPAKNKGIPVRSYYNLPVTFTIKENSLENW